MKKKNKRDLKPPYLSNLAPGELAIIVASLARTKGKDDYAKLATEALRIWLICEKTIAHEKFIYEIAAERAPKDLKLYGKLDKETYTLKELERQGFKTEKTATDRRSKVREFLNVWLRIEKARNKNLEQCVLPVDQREDVEWSTLDEPSLDERNAALKTYDEQGFDKGTYCLMLQTIHFWKGMLASKKASKGGKAKAAKEKAAKEKAAKEKAN
jgi:hypothetical protein